MHFLVFLFCFWSRVLVRAVAMASCSCAMCWFIRSRVIRCWRGQQRRSRELCGNFPRSINMLNGRFCRFSISWQRLNWSGFWQKRNPSWLLGRNKFFIKPNNKNEKDKNRKKLSNHCKLMELNKKVRSMHYVGGNRCRVIKVYRFTIEFNGTQLLDQMH